MYASDDLVNESVALCSQLGWSDPGEGKLQHTPADWDEVGQLEATSRSSHFQSMMGISDRHNKFSEGLSLCV